VRDIQSPVRGIEGSLLGVVVSTFDGRASTRGVKVSRYRGKAIAHDVNLDTHVAA
jgi:hypothetical protein